MNQTIYSDIEKNAIRFSAFKRLESDCPFSGIGLKFVASGEEIYYAKNKKYKVKAGEYIIGNEYTDSKVKINSNQPVYGVCIDISSKIVSDIAEYYVKNGSELEEFLLSDQFFVNCYKVNNTRVGVALNDIYYKIKSGKIVNDFQENELFYSLAEYIITDQKFVFEHLSKLDFKKKNTNEDVFKLLIKAKSFIDDNITENLSLDIIANQTGISKYHFIRVFKMTFGISPYQYQNNRRLEFAKSDLIGGNEIFSTALRYGFSDVPTFAKAFKKQFGQTPGSLKNK
jgi:AraC family transcriptional regulator